MATLSVWYVMPKKCKIWFKILNMACQTEACRRYSRNKHSPKFSSRYRWHFKIKNGISGANAANYFYSKKKWRRWMFVQLRKEPESLEQFSRATRLETVFVSSENINVGSGLTRGLHSRPRGYRNHSGGLVC